MSKTRNCTCDGINTGCSQIGCPGQSPRTTITVEREIPKLSYELMEGNLKNLQGQVLTVVEAIGGTMEQTKAAKSLIRSFFNQQLTRLFEMYGYESHQELPNYSSPSPEDGMTTLLNQ